MSSPLRDFSANGVYGPPVGQNLGQKLLLAPNLVVNDTVSSPSRTPTKSAETSFELALPIHH
jgi:hypothetical protein